MSEVPATSELIVTVPASRIAADDLRADLRSPRGPYASQLETTLVRLVSDVTEAAGDGEYAVRESATLHTWVRAELLPWAASCLSSMDENHQERVRTAIAELAARDAELLGAAGAAASAAACQIEATALELLTGLNPAVAD